VNAIRRFVCALLGHASWPGTDPRLAITYHCPRCGRIADGGLSLNR